MVGWVGIKPTLFALILDDNPKEFVFSTTITKREVKKTLDKARSLIEIGLFFIHEFAFKYIIEL